MGREYPSRDRGGASQPDVLMPAERHGTAFDGSTGLGHLRARIQDKLGELSVKQRALAHFIMENHARALFASANEVGAAVGTSAATVVRFAQLLGYDGFTELRDSLREGVFTFPSFLDQLSDLAQQPFSSDSELTNLVFRWERENLSATASMLDSHALGELAKKIPSARKTVLLGTGVGGVVVKLLAGHLNRLGLSLMVPVDTVDAVISMANVGPEDVVLGVSFWRFDRATSERLHQAKRRGAVTAAIVDSPLYPAAKDVDHLLVVSSKNTGHGPSAVSATAVANALLSAVILTDYDRFYRAIQHIDDAYAESRVYLE